MISAAQGQSRPSSEKQPLPQLSHAMANTLMTSDALFKTYVPVQEATIVQVTEARRKGRQRLRGGNKTG